MPEFQPSVENRLMDEIYSAIHGIKLLSKRSSGLIKIRTLSVTSKSLKTSKPVGISTTIKVGDTNEKIQKKLRLAEEKFWLIRIKRMFDIELEGGISSENGFWNIEQMQLLYKFLKTLPRHFYSYTQNIERVKSFGSRVGVMGYVFGGQPKVFICNWGVRPIKYEETLIHEMAHVWMFAKENRAKKAEFINKFWPGNKQPGKNKEQPPTLYGYSSAYEDFAESVRLYWQDCPKLKKTHPQRWAFLKKYVFKGRQYLRAAKPASANSKTIDVSKSY